MYNNNYDNIPIPAQLDDAVNKGMGEVRRIHRVRVVKKTIVGLGSTAAALTAFLLVCLSNPVMAAKLPLVGHIFETMQDNFNHSGDYSEVAVPLAEDGEDAAESAYTQTKDGMTVTLSELYCNNEALYITMLLESEDPFPDTMRSLDENRPMISIDSIINWKFNPGLSEDYTFAYIEGDFIDEHTFAGLVRFDMSYVGVDQAEYFAKMEEAYEKGEEEAFEAGQWDHLKKPVDIPEAFSIDLEISRIVGYLVDPVDRPQLDMTEEEIEALSDEEFSALIMEREKGFDQYPNTYENYWFDGAWNFQLDVKVDHSRTQTVEVGTTNDEGAGIASVTKTPFEMSMKMILPSDAADYIGVILDADGNRMPYGSDGNIEVYAIQDRDVSKVDVYICDYVEYMDELKGYAVEDRDKTFKEVLDERAVYHTSVQFDTEN